MAFFRNAILTINNFTEEDVTTLNTSDKILFATWQFEKGASGTPHIQGYVEFATRIRLAGVKKLFPRAHIEARKGTQEEAIAYCNKADTRTDGPWTRGNPKQQGQRNDLEQVAADLASGHSVKEIAQNHPGAYLKYHAGIKSMWGLQFVERTTKPTVHWLYGPTGAGKTLWALQQEGTLYPKIMASKWWDGYHQQDIVLLDDIRRSHFPFDFLLRLLDWCPIKVEYKGGVMDFNSKVIIITCPLHPEKLFEGNGEDINQLLRRIDTIHHFEKPYETAGPQVKKMRLTPKSQSSSITQASQSSCFVECTLIDEE